MPLRLPRLAAALTTLALLAAGPATHARPGSLDPSFGTGGRQAYDFTDPNGIVGTEGRDLVMLPDGRSVLLSSETNNSSAPKAYLSRHNLDGSLDTSFGVAGKAILAPPCDPCYAFVFALSRAPDGKLLVAGNVIHPMSGNVAPTSTYVQRYSADGVLDTTFGSAGSVTFQPEPLTHGLDMAVSSAGHIVLAGRMGPGTVTTSGADFPTLPPSAVHPGRWFVAVLDASGMPRTGFDGDGVAHSPLGTGSRARKVEVQPDDRIVVLGDDASGVWIGGYQADGATDMFRRVELPSPPGTARHNATDLAVRGDGRIWVATFISFTPEPGGWVVRLLSTGEIDPAFKSGVEIGGMPAQPHPVPVHDASPSSIVPMPDGGAIVGGINGYDAAFLRIRGDAGEIDIDWADVGRIHVRNLAPIEMSLKADGRVMGAATGRSGGPSSTSLRANLFRIDPLLTSFVVREWLRWGVQSLGTTSDRVDTTVLVTNTSGAAATITTTITANFVVGPTSDCGTLAPGASCKLRIRFSPTSTDALFGFGEEFTGTLSITSSAGQSATVTLRGIIEHSLVTHFYRNILQREPDPAGNEWWNSEARRVRALLVEMAGTSRVNTSEAWYAMAQALFGSPEYRDRTPQDSIFVSDLYQTFFDRLPDNAGWTYWNGELANGLPRDAVLASFMFSPEFTARTEQSFRTAPNRPEIDTVLDLYRGFLSRLPDDAGFRYWAGRLRQAQCSGAAAVHQEVETLSDLFAESPEYAARARSNAEYVSDLYNAFMRRGGDRPGIVYWTGRLGSGSVDRKEVRRQFLISPEFNARVQAMIAAGCKA